MASCINDLRREIMESPHPEESYQDALYFESDLKAPLKNLRINFLPIQDGAGDPSLSNIRPISGWNGLEISHYGKNLLPTSPDDWINAAWAPTETYIANTSRLCIDKTIPIKPNTTYTISIPSFFIGVNIYNSSGNRIYDSGWQENTLTFTTASTANTFGVNVRYSDQGRIYPSIVGTEMLPQLELGSVATTYTPRTTISIDWTDEAGTLYGGYVDLVKGEVVEKQKIIDLGSMNWTQRTASGVPVSGLFYSEVISDKGSAGISLVCDRYLYQYVYQIDQTVDKTINDTYQVRARCVNIRDSDYAEYSEAQFRAAMAGVKCVYVLAEPIHHPINPITLKALRGINNIWSDSNGAITAKYWSYNKNKNQIDKIHLLDTFILNGGALA